MNNELLKTDKITHWSLVSNAVLLIALLLLLRGSTCRRMTPCEEVRRTSDTVVRYSTRTDTMYRTLTAYMPRVERILTHTWDTIYGIDSAATVSCSDTVVYSDSIYRAREFKAIIQDRITANRIAQRTIRWADLTPITDRTVTTTITVEKPEPLVKVYLGAATGVRYTAPLTRGGLDIAPAASLIISDRYMIDAGYYILGGEISAGLKVKLSFRK